MKIKVNNIYHCRTEKDAKDLLQKLHDLGYQWYSEVPLTSKTEWNVYKEETCYRIWNKKIVSYGSIDYYVDEIGDGFIEGEIIEYKKQPIIDIHIKHQVAYENWQECEKQIENLIRLIEALDITVEDSDIYDDREMLVVPKRTIHDVELVELFKEIKEW